MTQKDDRPNLNSTVIANAAMSNALPLSNLSVNAERAKAYQRRLALKIKQSLQSLYFSN